jgi:ribosomal-protein-alanine N-acetyltransferase
MTSLITITRENGQFFLPSILEIEELSFPSPWTLNAFKAELKKSISHLWALRVAEVLSGYICFWMFANEIELLSLAVHPQKRCRGLGHYLVTSMIERGMCEGIRQFWLEVRPSNGLAKSLYQRLGFKEVFTRPLYYHDTREDGIVMNLNLSGEEHNGLSSQ